ncbi:MAG: manganese efflux pump MntP family protein [Bacteroidales bacterium]|jgi:putative Mn2+ efflux pump MntP|nr:manganese efflux pump MntP family protein [Bacteroidales bacterium]HHV40258.1 manganese efflux pump [Bacteroidales bacterium]
MDLLNLIFLSVGLAMDAFAVSVCKGMAQPRMNWGNALKAGLYFGVFQALMPLVGYVAGYSMHHLIHAIDHWIAFGLLGAIGGKMIVDSFNKDRKANCSFGIRSMLVLAFATSIDALAVGITLSFMDVSILFAVLLIGAVTFVLSFTGVRLGYVFGKKFSVYAERIGGIILILIGIKILIEHLSMPH